MERSPQRGPRRVLRVVFFFSSFVISYVLRLFAIGKDIQNVWLGLERALRQSIWYDL